ncbi:MAG: hypothetical protein ABI417_05870 [Coleofasciculaceae cyanobacterium]
MFGFLRALLITGINLRLGSTQNTYPVRFVGNSPFIFNQQQLFWNSGSKYYLQGSTYHNRVFTGIGGELSTFPL